MAEQGPVRRALRLVGNHPAVVLPELAARWAVVVTAALLLLVSVWQVMSVVEAGPARMRRLDRSQLRLLARIAAEAVPLLSRALLIIAGAILAFWVVASAFLRASFFARLLAALEAAGESDRAAFRGTFEKQEQLAGGGATFTFRGLAKLISLNALRVLLGAVAVLAVVGAFLLFSSIPFTGDGWGTAAGVLGSFLLLAVVLRAWSLFSGVLSLAQLFVVRDRIGVYAAIKASAGFYAVRTGAGSGIAVRFGLGRLFLWLAAYVLSLVIVLQAGAGDAPAGTIVPLLLVLLAYSAASSWLYAANLAAYLFLMGGSSGHEGKQEGSPSFLPVPWETAQRLEDDGTSAV